MTVILSKFQRLSDFRIHFRTVRLYSSTMKELGYINGKWIGAASGKTFAVLNPANGEQIGTVPDMDCSDTQRAIESAKTAFKTWSQTTARERSTYIRKFFELMSQRSNELGQLLTKEQGKPIKEGIGEVLYGASYFEWYAEEAKRIHGEVVQSPTATKELIFIRQPIGVVGLITPWNFPNAMLARKLSAALACGCTAVIKPAEDTPFSAIAFAEIAEEVKLPPGVVNLVTCSRANASSVGKTLCESPDVAGISFTGSTAVGKILYQQSASTVKRLSLELGGNAPFIIFDSADVNSAVVGTMASKFRNSGQTCVSANRVLVQEGIHDKFVAALTEAMTKQILIGDGLNPDTTQGPLINEAQANKVEMLVKDAVEHGGNITMGGNRHSKGKLFYEPTLISNVDSSMKIYSEEIFGPVVSIIRFKTEDEAVTIANSARTGLAGYFYSQDIAQCWRVAKRLEVGMVGINEGMLSCVEAAFGGVKESGLGREGSRHGIDEFTNIKYLCFGGL